MLLQLILNPQIVSVADQINPVPFEINLYRRQLAGILHTGVADEGRAGIALRSKQQGIIGRIRVLVQVFAFKRIRFRIKNTLCAVVCGRFVYVAVPCDLHRRSLQRIFLRAGKNQLVIIFINLFHN